MATNVALETTMGTIVVELYHEHAPKTCTNFSTLASRGYYDTLLFHRIIPNFMLQTGDPTGTGRGGSSIYGEKFEDEISTSLKHTGAAFSAWRIAGRIQMGASSSLRWRRRLGWMANIQYLDGSRRDLGL
ncbi:Peptidyl-prolyl cis-trans isomerase-like [Lachnellula suecica]|uniref:Peptidyl-prolyl cis-trans isomerase n=1 Tax=Lachnellula suecica TaxID=602035 RepID=A0A8T9C571_9HELO|nr:Peptidyl-prolyl cis-trans isomerase-like [Lachnellula suecica]